MLDEKRRRAIEELLVEVVLDIRAEYLRTTGCNVLKHWDQIQERVRIAARTTGSVEEWLTNLRRRLVLGAPTGNSSRSCDALVSEVRDEATQREFLDLVERRYAFVMARARRVSEERREAREESAT